MEGEVVRPAEPVQRTEFPGAESNRHLPVVDQTTLIGNVSHLVKLEREIQVDAGALPLPLGLPGLVVPRGGIEPPL